MTKEQEQQRNDFNKSNLYKDALVMHLIHNGYKRKLAELKVRQMMRNQE